MSKKYTLDQVKDYFSQFNYQVLSNQYLNVKQKLDVICPNGHKWKVSFFDFKVRGVRCPKCYGNYYNKEDKIKEIKEIFEKHNYKVLKIVDTKNIYVKCPNNHEWKTSLKRFKKGLRCPYCSGRRKTFLYIKEFIEKENYKLLSTSYKYHDKLRIKCPNGHVFEMKWNDFHQGHRCPECQIKYNLNYNEIKNLVENDNLGKYKLLSNESEIKNSYFKVKCLECDYEFETNLYRWLNGNRFLKCWQQKQISNIEKEIYNLLEQYNIDYFKHERTIISPYEIDIYLPEYKLGIEVCGLFWHSYQIRKDKYYHQKKWKLSYQKGIKLLQIFEDEWHNYKETIKSKILLLCGKTDNFNKFRANELNIIYLNNKDKYHKHLFNEFLNRYHLQGQINSYLFSLCLSNKKSIDNVDDILGLIVISKNRFSKQNKDELEIIRLCFKPYTLIYGGATKLIKHSIQIIKQHYNDKYKKLISFADLRYFSSKLNDNFYTRLGFKVEKITEPNYYYFDKDNPKQKFHRFSFRKRKGEPENINEFQLRESEGWYWIYDAGHVKYVYEI